MTRPCPLPTRPLAQALLAALLASAACGRDDHEPPTPAAPDAEPAPEPLATTPTPAPDPEPQSVEPGPGPEEEPIEPPEEPPPTVAEPGQGVVLAPRFSRGTVVRRRVTLTRTTDLAARIGDRDASARIETQIDATYTFRVTRANKGAPIAATVRIETFDRTASGAPAPLESDPQDGETWACRVDRDPHVCTREDGAPFVAPSWLAVDFGPLLPARPVVAGESWSRRVGVASLLGFGEAGIARATLRAEAPYETGDGRFTTVTLSFDASDEIRAFGRTLRLDANGTGALEFDIDAARVATLDVQWSGVASAQRRIAGGERLGTERQTSLTLRMTELPLPSD